MSEAKKIEDTAEHNGKSSLNTEQVLPVDVTHTGDLDVQSSINTMEKIIQEIEGFTNEIDRLTTKELEAADASYIRQGKFVVKTKTITRSLQKNAHRQTTDFASSLECACSRFTDQKAERIEEAFKKGDTEPLDKMVAMIGGDIQNGMNHINKFNSLCDKVDTFCIKLEQTCADQVIRMQTQEWGGKISTLTATEIAFVIAIVMGIATAFVGVKQVFQISNVMEASVPVLVIAGIVIYGIAKILTNRWSVKVYNEAVASLTKTKKITVSLQMILEEFEKTQRVVIACADDVLWQTVQFKKSGDDIVAILHSKLQQLQKMVGQYRSSVTALINKLDDLSFN